MEFDYNYFQTYGYFVAEDDDLGYVVFQEKSVARQFIARWKNGELRVTVPMGAGKDEIIRAFESMRPKLKQRKSELRYHEGQRLDFGELAVNIVRQDVEPGGIIVKKSRSEVWLLVGSDYRFDEAMTTNIISRGLRRIVHGRAAEILIPRCRELAGRHGCKVARWEISSGMKVLGSCSATGVIKISSACVFLPRRLRDYIICHELAHLTEMNHSPRFHKICDEYVGGEEKRLAEELKRFCWPVLK